MAETKARFLANLIGADNTDNDFTLPNTAVSGTDNRVLTSQGDGTVAWEETLLTPTVYSVSPTNIEESDTTQTIVITGVNFDGSASAVLIDNNGTTKTPTTSTRNSDTQITIVFSGSDVLDNTVAEPLDVKVTQGGSSLTHTLVNALTIDARPVWSSPNAGALTDQTYIEDEAITQVNFVATDPEGQTPTYSITSGALPTGLTLSSAGALTGTPNVNDSYNSSGVQYNFTITANDTTGNTTDRAFSITRKWRDGSASGQAAISCQAIMDLTSTTTSGTYWIYADTSVAAAQHYCDMSTHSGIGWTLVGTRANNTNLAQNGQTDNTSSYGTDLSTMGQSIGGNGADNVYKGDWKHFGSWTKAWQQIGPTSSSQGGRPQNNFYFESINSDSIRTFFGDHLVHWQTYNTTNDSHLDCRKFLSSVGQPGSGGTVVADCGQYADYEGWTTDPGVGWCWWHHPSNHPGTGDCGVSGYSHGYFGNAWIGG